MSIAVLLIAVSGSYLSVKCAKRLVSLYKQFGGKKNG